MKTRKGKFGALLLAGSFLLSAAPAFATGGPETNLQFRRYHPLEAQVLNRVDQ